ncbi:YybH family protein [Flavobacterium ajazii]|uniref:YybH family protein n=1 Tax=Flavobacterium ajazii TaxID=2692318 RepID=UPI0013D79ED9|nr:nuclear transport factor 2 family protein [Flavobacterium ajazii]
MKKSILKGVLLVGILAFMLACNNKQEVQVIDKEQIKKEIQAKEDEFAATYNEGKIKNIGYYADDAVTYYPNAEPLVGKESILEFLTADLAEGSKNKISFKTGEVFVSSDGVQVLETGTFQVKDSTDILLNKGNYMSFFEKRDGKYVCVRDMSASDIVAK